MLSGTRILIVEREFLIALDIQRVLDDAGARQTIVARNISEANALSAYWSEFDLAIIEGLFGSPDAVELAGRLRAAGLQLVVTTADPSIGHLFGGARLVEKPFGENALLDACRAALGS